MAYQAKYGIFGDDTDADKRRKAQNTSLGGGVGGAMPDYTPQTAQTPGSGVAGDSGSDFVNFEQYFNANADASNQMAGSVATGVATAADKARGGVQKAASDFNTNLKNNTMQYGGEKIETENPDEAGTYGNAGGQAGLQDKKQGLSGDIQRGADGGAPPPPTGTIQAAAAQAKAEATPNFGESGIFDDLKGMGGDVADASQGVRALGSSAGIEGLLEGMNADQYSQGENALDGMLAGAAGRPAFDKVQSQYGNLDKYYQDTLTSAGKAADEADIQNAAVSGKYQTDLDNYFREQERKKALAAGRGDDAAIKGERAKVSYEASGWGDPKDPIRKKLYGQVSDQEWQKIMDLSRYLKNNQGIMSASDPAKTEMDNLIMQLWDKYNNGGKPTKSAPGISFKGSFLDPY